MTKTTRKQLFALADSQGIHIATWSPGDGMTRYRFIDKRSEPHWCWSYDATSHPLYTALGLREASIWLLGYASGQNTKWKREQLYDADLATNTSQRD